jgi:23S rRNA pseudouridine2457 synthase
MFPLLLFNKPFNVLCQFSDDQGRQTLGHWIDSRQYPHFYPAGRLDYDSEGLVALTNQGPLQHRLSDPSHKLPKVYWVQVEGQANDSHIKALSKGLLLSDGPCKPCQATPMAPPEIWARQPPVRFRAQIPTSWLEITLTEGRNRQVRRMTAAVGLPTLRLIRVKIGPWTLNPLAPGESRLEQVSLPKSAQAVRKPNNRNYR